MREPSGGGRGFGLSTPGTGRLKISSIHPSISTGDFCEASKMQETRNKKTEERLTLEKRIFRIIVGYERDVLRERTVLRKFFQRIEGRRLRGKGKRVGEF